MMIEVALGSVLGAMTGVGTESLSMTGGMVDVRFCFSCSMTSATFEELASFVTGMTATSLCVAIMVVGMVPAKRPLLCSAFT